MSDAIQRRQNISACASGLRLQLRARSTIQTARIRIRYEGFSRSVTALTLQRVRERLHSRTAVRIINPHAGEAAVALLLTPASDDLDALFIRRAQKAGDPWSGHVALPGGRRDTGDADLFGTAVRETREETGVSLTPFDLLGEADDITPRTPVLPNIIIRPFVFALGAKPAVHPSSEVASWLWVPLSRLKSAATRTQVDIRGSPTEVPAFVLGSDVIWGLTERILKPIIDLLDG